MKEEKLKLLKDTAMLYNDKASVSLVPSQVGVHIEVKFYKDGKAMHKGYTIGRLKGSPEINIGELYGTYPSIILNNFFYVDKDKKMKIKFGEVKNKNIDFSMIVKNDNKNVNFLVNGNQIFRIGKVRRQENHLKQVKYYISQKSVMKAQEVLSSYLTKMFETDINDYDDFNDLLAAVAEYLNVYY